MKYDVVIIGSGLGGLECGYLLAKCGMNVCVLERSHVLGGCLQTFKRGGRTFDTGFHYVGGLDEGQHLNRLFKYFGLMDLPWTRLGDNCDDVMIDGEVYHIMTGHERYLESLAERFPAERENLKTYLDFLKNVGDHIFDSFLGIGGGLYGDSLFARSAKEYLCETIKDPRLRDVLAGTSLKMELTDGLPLYTFAQINDSFIRSAWRIDGGGSLIAESLAESIKAMGGTVRKKAEVYDMTETNGCISSVSLSSGEVIECANVISDAHPAHTLSLIHNSNVLRHSFRQRISSLENTYGTFTANMSLKPGLIEYRDKNLYVYDRADLWKYEPKDRTDRLLVSFYKPAEGKYCDSIDLLTPMSWSETLPWADKPMGRRGESYVEMKRRKTEQCIELASRLIPGLPDAVERSWTSTPLSYKTYTNTIDGSSYGIRKDFSRCMFTVLSPSTPIRNLFLTGQNLNLHGILGVTMTSLFSCACLVGSDKVADELKLREVRG